MNLKISSKDFLKEKLSLPTIFLREKIEKNNEHYFEMKRLRLLSLMILVNVSDGNKKSTSRPKN